MHRVTPTVVEISNLTDFKIFGAPIPTSLGWSGPSLACENERVVALFHVKFQLCRYMLSSQRSKYRKTTDMTKFKNLVAHLRKPIHWPEPNVARESGPTANSFMSNFTLIGSSNGSPLPRGHKFQIWQNFQIQRSAVAPSGGVETEVYHIVSRVREILLFVIFFRLSICALVAKI